MFNIMVANGLAMQGANAYEAMTLTSYPWILTTILSFFAHIWHLARQLFLTTYHTKET